MLIVIGNVAPIGRVISVIPAPVVGGTALVVYAIVMVLGVQLLRKVDFHEQSNMVIAAVAFAAGLLPILIPGCYDQFPANVRILLGSRVAMGAFVAAFLNFLFHHLGSAGKQAADRDIIEVKHDEHHDAPVPGHPAHAAHSATGDEVTVAVASGGTKRELAEEARRRAQKVVADSPVDIVHPTATEHRRSTLARQRRGGRR